MQVVPLADVPSQLLSVQLNGQTCQIKVHTESTGLYMDVYVNNVLILAGVICQNVNRIIRDAYFGFLGDFTFFDTQGGVTGSDPSYPGLGTRYVLLYLEVADLS